MRAFNVRLFIVVSLAGVLIAATVYYVHRNQVRRHATMYLNEARKAHDEGRLSDAVRFAQKYVSLRPTDSEGLAEYGRLLIEIGAIERAFFVYDQLLRRDPGRSDVRREMVDIRMILGRFSAWAGVWLERPAKK